MRRFTVLATSSLTLSALVVGGDLARAQTVYLDPVANGSFIYGNTSFTVTGCTFNGGACGASDNARIVGVSNGRNGTEIDIVSANGSAIFSTIAGSANTTLSFDLEVTPNPGSHGLSAIQNIIAGSDGRASEDTLVTSVLTAGSGVTNATGSGTSTLASTTNTTSFTLTQGSVNVNVGLGLNSAGATAGDTLKLTSVRFLFTPAPEPASLALIATGLAGLMAARRRRKSARRMPASHQISV